MEIKIKSSEELNILLDSLRGEIIHANILSKLYYDLNKSIDEYRVEFGQSNTFWFYALNSINNSCMTSLCRIYDQHSKSLNLYNLLDTINKNIKYFKTNEFQNRLKNNPFVDSLSKSILIPDKKQLEDDIKYASKDNILVKKLIVWRNNIIAHKSPKVFLGKGEILEQNALTSKDVTELLDKCFEIYNRYSSLYRASTASRQVIGADDYKSVLKFMRLGLQKYEEDIENEVVKYQ